MTDHKFTDDDVIKALECCDENDCYPCCYRIGGVDCRDRMQRDALALINRQKAEIEKLGRDRYQILPDGSLELIPRTDINAIKAEAIKEFAWRLKSRLTPYPEVPFCEMVGSLDIDALVEEMTEDLK